MRVVRTLLPLLVVLLYGGDAVAAPVTSDVSDDTQLRAALKRPGAGAVIRLAPGTYAGGIYVERIRGSEAEPIIVESRDAKDLAVIEGGTEGIHLTDVAHVTLRNLIVRGQSGNGINIDDGGSYDTPSHHVTIENVVVREVGPKGNRDAIKLSGVDDFVVRGCDIEAWAGQAIDMVGCHRGRIENCRFTAADGYDSTTGPQAKGGSSEILITGCRFAGPIGRGVNIGGSTGLQYFRPKDRPTFEAKDVTVENCEFAPGVIAPVAFVGADGAVVRRNVIHRPARWVMRILQETTADGFVPCRNGRFENNTVVFRRAEVREAVNIGPNTDPASFVFAGNTWYCEDAPPHSRPTLPSTEQGGKYGIKPTTTTTTRSVQRLRTVK